MLGFCSRLGLYFNTFKTAQLLASNDGSSFTKLLDLEFKTQPTSVEEVIWLVPNKQKFLYYRLNIDACFGDRISVGRLRFYS